MKKIKYLIMALVLVVNLSQVQAQHTDGFKKILTNYFELKNALTADNNQLARTNAGSLLQAVNTLPTGSYSADQQKLWRAYKDKLAFDSRHISESTDIDHQREHFASLSKNMFDLVKDLKLNTSIVYEQYCPMKKAYWLSETAVINNPYYGKHMQSCGKIVATLKPSAQ